MEDISAHQLAKWLADADQPRPLLLDVREDWELEICQLAGSKHLPMHLVPLRKDELGAEQDIVVICHHGGRSMQVAMFLEHQGFSRVYNLMGGIEAWATEVAPDMRRY